MDTTDPDPNCTVLVFLSKPEWMWGAEMGANEFGVVIGKKKRVYFDY